MFLTKRKLRSIILLIPWLGVLSNLFNSHNGVEYGIDFDSEKPILLIFFSMDCSVCFKQLLTANLHFDKFSNKIDIYGITRDDPESLKQFRVKYNIKFPLVYDKFAKFHKKFKINNVPMRVLIKEKKIIYKDDPNINFSDRDSEFNKMIKELL